MKSKPWTFIHLYEPDEERCLEALRIALQAIREVRLEKEQQGNQNNSYGHSTEAVAIGSRP